MTIGKFFLVTLVKRDLPQKAKFLPIFVSAPFSLFQQLFIASHALQIRNI